LGAHILSSAGGLRQLPFDHDVVERDEWMAVSFSKERAGLLARSARRQLVNASMKNLLRINTPKRRLFDETIDMLLLDGDVAP
jgi:hypothetical protein